MYVQLKHALSTLALRAVQRPFSRAVRAEVAWLAAYRALAASLPARHSFGIPIARVAPRARPHQQDRAALRRLVRRGLLEMDLDTLWLPAGFHTSFPYLDRQVRRLTAVLRRPAVRAAGRGPRGRMIRGAALFGGGLFFECHEYFETIWRAARARDRDLYQGIIQVAAAFYHYEKGNLHGAGIKLASGIDRLQAYRPASHGVELDGWLAKLAPWRDRVAAGAVAGPLEAWAIPAIPLTRGAHGRKGRYRRSSIHERRP